MDIMGLVLLLDYHNQFPITKVVLGIQQRGLNQL